MPSKASRRLTVPLLLALAAALLVLLPGAPRASAGPCDAPIVNPIVCENSRTGSPRSEWDVTGAGSTAIQGFATDISVNAGQTIRFKVATTATAYRIDIYRLGWYGGNGARKVDTVYPSAALPQNQPPCDTDNQVTGLVDCSNWAESASWAVPSTAVSGYYIARLVRTSGSAAASHIAFVVRDDASTSDLLMQASDATWQAYNEYGGNSLYEGQPAGRAYKVSYNRPFTTRGDNPEDWLFNAEYPMIRFLERNGYDVTYTTNIDTERRGQLIQNHRVFLSVGHDEYWSAGMRANVEQARDAGVNLAFFSGNEVFWKTRYENGGINGTGDPYRTLVSYKDTHANQSIDPLGPSMWTGTWRDPRFSPPGDGGRPENALTGQLFTVTCCTTDMYVNDVDGKLRLWRGSRVASLAPGTTTTLGSGILGYEWDSDVDNGHRPAGQIRLSSTTQGDQVVLQDWGSTYATGTRTHNLTMYRAPSGALVFGAGTVQWSWGLDPTRTSGTATTDTAVQQATVNLLADMGAQPGTLMAGLVAATASTDTTPPVSAVTSPVGGQNVAVDQPLTVTGTAADTGGRVGGVEVSVDGGATWHPATTGRESWSYTFTPEATGPITIRSRATDDSLRTETPGPGVQVTVGSGGPPPAVNCPCTLWPAGTVPAAGPDPDTSPNELGVKFKADRDGFVGGIRFYKHAQNTGTHVGTLWTASGTPITSATFADETPSGWQEVLFAQPVPITAGTTYVASYYAPNGSYAADVGYFDQAFARAPLTAPSSAAAGGNGVYRFGQGFPDQVWQNANYWVDVVFTTDGTPPPPAPVVTARTPAPGATGADPAAGVSATFDADVQPATVAWSLKGPDNAAVTGTASWDAATRTATFAPAADLVPGTAYTVTLSGATGAGGTAMAPLTWTFTTAGTPPGPVCAPCTIWPSTAVPGTPSDPDTAAVELGVKFRTTVAGTITGIRFYKGTGNTGPHTATLWSATGQPLASAPFTNETATGWQTVTFPAPVAVTPGTTYIASYHAPAGRYAADTGGLLTAAGTGPVQALADGTDGANGVYRYGSSGFPTSSWEASNYWVDVLFVTS